MPETKYKFYYETTEYESNFSRQFEERSKGRGFRMANRELLLRKESSEFDEITIIIEVEIKSKCREI